MPSENTFDIINGSCYESSIDDGLESHPTTRRPTLDSGISSLDEWIEPWRPSLLLLPPSSPIPSPTDDVSERLRGWYRVLCERRRQGGSDNRATPTSIFLTSAGALTEQLEIRNDARTVPNVHPHQRCTSIGNGFGKVGHTAPDIAAHDGNASPLVSPTAAVSIFSPVEEFESHRHGRQQQQDDGYNIIAADETARHTAVAKKANRRRRKNRVSSDLSTVLKDAKLVTGVRKEFEKPDHHFDDFTPGPGLHSSRVSPPVESVPIPRSKNNTDCASPPPPSRRSEEVEDDNVDDDGIHLGLLLSLCASSESRSPPDVAPISSAPSSISHRRDGFRQQQDLRTTAGPEERDGGGRLCGDQCGSGFDPEFRLPTTSTANDGDRMERSGKPAALTPLNVRCACQQDASAQAALVTAARTTTTTGSPVAKRIQSGSAQFYSHLPPNPRVGSSGSPVSPSGASAGHQAPIRPAAATQPWVRSKPQLPAYFTVRRRPALRKVFSDPHESGAHSDGEIRTELESIETILGELDFSKYRRRGNGVVPPSSPSRLSSSFPAPKSPLLVGTQRTTPPASSGRSPSETVTTPRSPTTITGKRGADDRTHDDKLRELKELTEKLKPAIHRAKQEVDLLQSYGWSGRPAAARSTLPRRYQPVLRSASVPAVDDIVGTAYDPDQESIEAENHRRDVWHVTAPTPVRRHDHDCGYYEGNWTQPISAISRVTNCRPSNLDLRMTDSDEPKSPGRWFDDDNAATFRAAPSNLSLDSASDQVFVEGGQVADSDYPAARSYLNLTSASAPTTPGPYRRAINSGAATPSAYQSTFDSQVEAALAELQRGAGQNSRTSPSSTSSQYNSLDRRRRRKGVGWYVGFPLRGSVNSADGSKPSSNNGRSLTFPPQRRGSASEGAASASDELAYTSMDSNGMRSYWNSGESACATAAGVVAAADRRRRQQTSEEGGRRAQMRRFESAACEPPVSPRCELTGVDDDESALLIHVDDTGGSKLPKKKHNSDPSGSGGGEKTLLDLPEMMVCSRSEPQLPAGDQSSTSLVSAIPMTSPVSPIRSEHSADGCPSSPSMSVAPRNSPDMNQQQQRRYSKKRLRGPYGELLEEEMRKSGEKHLQKLTIPEELQVMPGSRTPTSPPPTQLEGGRRLRQCSESLDDDDDDVDADDPEDCDQRSFLTASPCPERGSIRTDGDEGSDVLLRNSGGSGDVPLNLCEGLDVKGDDAVDLNRRHPDTRTHVVAELYDTEKSYVESLQILVNKYFRQLKGHECSGFVDAGLVDDMFFQIPEILGHHETFLDVLRQRLETWDNKQKVGDVFVESFAKQPIIDTYTSFINNWKTAKEAIKIASQSKPAFAKYLEHLSREHKGKLTLDALLIMPVQRIPRYELLLKELLKHTQMDHPDHRLLVIAQKEVHDLAVKINHIEREAQEAEQMQFKLKEMESVIDGLLDLVQPHRTFLRYDLVTMSGSLGTKKERCLFLFSDLLVITSIKRKSGTIRKTSTMGSPGSRSCSQEDWKLEANKYKLLMRIGLEELNIARSNDAHIKRALMDIQHLEEDVSTISHIGELAGGLHCPRQNLDEVVKEMATSVAKQLQEKQTSNSQLLCLELTVTTQVGLEMMSIIFAAPDKRASWEATFHEAKQKLALSTDRRPPPEFLFPLPIRKTRAGLQFTCAASTLGLNAQSLRDVWVCNSDGYVGQVCVLSLQPEPTVTSCNGVCNARILCITSIPAAADGVSHQAMTDLRRRSALTDDKSGTIHTTIEDLNEHDVGESVPQMGGNDIQLDSESSEEEKEMNSEEDDSARRKGGGGGGGDVAAAKSDDDARQEEVDNLEPTMWLGTEDGCIHVYNCNDNIRIKRNKVKLQHAAAIHCIIYLDGRVFVSLANGDLIVYSSDSKSGWNTNEPVTVTVGSASAPISRMLAVHGRLWCGCQCTVKVINTSTLNVEHSLVVHSDSSRPIQCIVTSGLGVWISIQNSSVVKLYHATSYEFLLDVNVSPAVTKMLAAGCDDIIRQHKAACLRVTALLACKDLLWVGTSAGVILNLALPHLTPTTTAKMIAAPNVSGIPHGHTGHVRFLTSVEANPSAAGLHDGLALAGRSRYSHRSIKYGKDGERQRRASAIATGPGSAHGGSESGGSSTAHRFLVISGGDGYEDFRVTDGGNCSEAAGRDDSTNHLLLWQV